jgi:hypothetical protein
MVGVTFSPIMETRITIFGNRRSGAMSNIARLETGVMEPEGDWPGIFIGDYILDTTISRYSLNGQHERLDDLGENLGCE